MKKEELIAENRELKDYINFLKNDNAKESGKDEYIVLIPIQDGNLCYKGVSVTAENFLIDNEKKSVHFYNGDDNTDDVVAWFSLKDIAGFFRQMKEDC